MTEYEYLKQQLISNSYQAFSYTNLDEDLTIYIIPESEEEVITSTKQIYNYHTDHEFIRDSKDLMILADKITHLKETISILEDDKKELYRYYKKYIKGRKLHDIHPDKLQVYLDWHEDIFGQLPDYPNEFGI